MRATALVGLLLLAACGQPAGRDAATAGSDAPSTPLPAAPAPPNAAARPLGDGQALTGAVSGLTGLVTAFRVEETATTIVVELAADVLFAFDRAELSPEAPEQLRKTVEQIARGGRGDIRVVGHTDSVGEDAYNDALSLRRARAVADWLGAEGGVARARLRPEGRGEREPVAPDLVDGRDSPDNRARNRRVTVIIPKP